MADDEHLHILKQGVEAWNKWRAENPDLRPDLAGADLRGAPLEGADLKKTGLAGADLTDAKLWSAKLSRANLTGANLTGANLTEAHLTHANLTDADLTRANLSRTRLSRADLTDANLFRANLSRADLTRANLSNAGLTDANLQSTNLAAAAIEDARFSGAKVNSQTRGLDRLSDNQRGGLVHVDQNSDPVEQSDAPIRAAQITVGTANRIIGPAHEVLSGLSIPNDLSEPHRDLFLELLRTVEDLQQSLAGLNDETRPLSDEPEELREKLNAALPLWKRAWETFVLKSAEGAGTSVGKGAVFTAGFIAGMISSAFAAEPPGIPI